MTSPLLGRQSFYLLVGPIWKLKKKKKGIFLARGMSNDSSLGRAVHWPALSAQEVTSAGISRGNTAQRPGWANMNDRRERHQPSLLWEETHTGLCKFSTCGNGSLNSTLVTFHRRQEQLHIVFQAKACSTWDGFQVKHGVRRNWSLANFLDLQLQLHYCAYISHDRVLYHGT